MINEKIESYCIAHSMEVNSVLDEIARYTHLKVQMPQMLSGKYQGQVLSFLSKLIKPKNILEIGTFTGYSGICLYQGIQENGKMTTIDKNGEIEEDVKAFFKKANVLRGTDYIIGNAMEIVPQLNELFDLVFIDADKKNYIHYLEMVAPKINKGGLLITDNVLWSGKILDEKKDSDTTAIDLFNKQLNQHPHFDVVVLPIRDGLSLAIKK